MCYVMVSCTGRHLTHSLSGGGLLGGGRRGGGGGGGSCNKPSPVLRWEGVAAKIDKFS